MKVPRGVSLEYTEYRVQIEPNKNEEESPVQYPVSSTVSIQYPYRPIDPYRVGNFTEIPTAERAGKLPVLWY